VGCDACPTEDQVSFINELKRRNVFKVGVAYVIISWLLAQVADLMLENFGAPEWVIKSFLGFLIIGFPLAIFFAWAFELTPEGVKRESQVDRSQSIAAQTGQKLNYSIMVIMALALAWFAWDRFGNAPETTAPAEETTVAAAETVKASEKPVKSLAVLPFVAMSSGADDEYFADGLTEEILNSLAQLPELLITARTSSFHFKGQDIPVQEIASALGVQHIVEGSVRRSGDRLRVTAQLIRAADGFHLWSENYDSTSSDTIQVQEDIAEKIAEAMNVVMDDEKRESMRKAGLRNVEAFVDYQKAMELYGEAHGDVNQIGYLRRTNEQLEKVMELVPTFSQAYIDHTDLYVHMLLDNSVGQITDGVTPEDIEQAPARIMEDMAIAAENASNFSERNAIELDLEYLSGDWRGLRGDLERYLDESDCTNPTWVPGIAAASGLADRYAKRAREVRKCDPMWSHAWFTESRAFLWAGDKEEALRVAREGIEVAPGGWLAIALVRALIANGLYEEIDHAITTQFRLKEDGLIANTMKSAAMGDRNAATAYFEGVMEGEYPSSFWESIYFAWIGDRENANRRAAKIDEHPFGSQSLLLLVYWCACGAPFDLEVTPNYAARIEAAGMPWPPYSPITFPLKDW
jgi:adenylate cyclase